jgi:hypothetical protein
MTESYRRRCKYCGKWIQIRQMPHGQWVAFEGYDTVHNCKNSTSKFTNANHSSSNYQRPYSSSGSSCMIASLCLIVTTFFLLI